MKPPPIQRIELSVDELESILQRAMTSPLGEEDCAKIKAVLQTYLYLTDLLEDKRTTIARLRKLLFGSSSEKTRDVVPPAPTTPPSAVPDGAEPSPPAAMPDGAESAPVDPDSEATPSKRPGHGRNGADEYEGATKIAVPHESLKSGDPCPDCTKGKVYEVATPGVLVRIVGQAPVQATVFELQKLRCNLCGKVFTAKAPQGVGSEKYDETAGSMIALLKYGSGTPFYRLEGLQENLGIPLPASTQWDIVSATAAVVEPVYEELIRQAAQGEVLHVDDTTIKILELMKQNKRRKALAEDARREVLAEDARREVLAEDARQERLADNAQRERLADDAPHERLGGNTRQEATAGDAMRSPSADGESRPTDRAPPDKRRGMFTSGIVATREGCSIALFFSGRQHAGENLADVLARRAVELGPPIQMCDALSRNRPPTQARDAPPRNRPSTQRGDTPSSDSPTARRCDAPSSHVPSSRRGDALLSNLPKELRTILGNCLAHGRRPFVDVAERFPEECRYVLEELAEVYKNDALARERRLSPQDRLHFHQAESDPIMARLKAWCLRQFKDRLVEPNSGLGEAISYMLKHWEPLTLFLRQPGAPLDNNICERALKRAILHRKNALFYKTVRGAHVGDVFMSLIHTCQLGGVNPFDYLTELQRHAAELSAAPANWMPWNYRATLREPAARSAAAG